MLTVSPLFALMLSDRVQYWGLYYKNCSIDKFSKDSYPYFYGKTEINSLEFVDDIADLNDQHLSALLSNKIIQNARDQKRLTFSAAKYEMLKINPTKTDSQASISINGETVKGPFIYKVTGGGEGNLWGSLQKYLSIGSLHMTSSKT